MLENNKNSEVFYGWEGKSQSNNELIPVTPSAHFSIENSLFSIGGQILYVDGLFLHLKEIEELVNKKDKNNVKMANDILYVRGYFPRLSEVQNIINNKNFNKNIKEIRVYSLDTLILDQDITWPGGRLSLIAPNWVIYGTLVTSAYSDHYRQNYYSRPGGAISLDGAEGADGNDEFGPDGAPGLPGQNGGYFFGMGSNFFSSRFSDKEYEFPTYDKPSDFMEGTEGFIFSKISTNGGKGGKGQNGKDCYKYVEGSKTIKECQFVRGSREPIKGDGGSGGVGGLGGFSVFIPLSIKTNFLLPLT